MGMDYEIIDGHVPVRRRDLAMSAFNRGDLDALVAHRAPLGRASTFKPHIRCATATAGLRRSTTKRSAASCDRQNAYPHVTHSVLVARDTIDAAILNALRQKESLLERASCRLANIPGTRKSRAEKTRRAR